MARGLIGMSLEEMVKEELKTGSRDNPFKDFVAKDSKEID